jgi:uncharacterized membrane protein YvbJ
MPYCPQCGTKIETQWNACPNCGYDLKQEFELIKANSQGTNQPHYERFSSDQQQENYRPIRTYSASPINTNGIIALIFGLLGFCCIIGSFYLIFIFAVIAIVFGAIGMKKDEKPQMAKIGLVLGIIDLACGIFFIVMMLPFIFYFLSPY